ncbi:4Fe-4S binding protein, partial [Candidatus Gracilibacteria bacterium]|nr:4Fe-4S binding protein [Candidatus Gracilibacteria bacterium]
MEIDRGKIIVMDRGGGKAAGQGVLKAMGVIWRHWRESFGKLERFDQTAGTFTIEYPEERRALPEAFRNMPILLYDDATGQELCTSCFQCQRICPPQVIHMTQVKDPSTGKGVPAVAEFIIEYDACMSCGFCAEVCPFDAIKMDHDFELSTDHHFGLTVDKQGLNRPVSYYERIAPTMWAAARESANKKLQANIKRRPAGVGIAPHLGQNSEFRIQNSEVAAQPVGERRGQSAEPRTQNAEPRTQNQNLEPRTQNL